MACLVSLCFNVPFSSSHAFFEEIDPRKSTWGGLSSQINYVTVTTAPERFEKWRALLQSNLKKCISRYGLSKLQSSMPQFRGRSLWKQLESDIILSRRSSQ